MLVCQLSESSHYSLPQQFGLSYGRPYELGLGNTEERLRLGVRKGNLTVRDYGTDCIVEWLSPVTCQAEAE